MPPAPDETTEIIIGWAVKIGAMAITFIGGIITATVTITRKMQGYDLRIELLEKNQKKCQSEVLQKISDKIDNLPESIGEKMDERLNRVHDRIDKIILDKK